MALPLAALLPVAGAAIGGLTGYSRSGGDIGAGLLGAGLGAAVPGGLRMAGSALGAKFAGTELSKQAGAGLMGGAARLRQVAANAPGTLQGNLAASGAAQLATGGRILSSPGLAGRILPGMAGGLAAGTGVLLGAPALAGGLAAGLAQPARTAAGAASGLGISAMQPSGQFDAGAAVPGGLPVGISPAGTLEVVDPSGRFAAARTLGLLEGDVQLANLKKTMPYLFEAAEARSKTEMQRQLAAAGVRQNILTAANLLEQSQRAAQQMGINAASQAGAALTSQYQYQ